MEKLILHKESCKSCHYCINICPKDAISLSSYMNSKGYQTIKVDEEKCVKCGSCYVMCPEYVFEIVEV
ncbi:4Fe-4S binding protein [Tepidibacter aestuarii]|uniref:4Fe-4S binding protein n=1 Tax=Tepidibacter aestuarii TaxID=2925782 RepID=UPI0020BD78AD|nr:4Fe-4S binding protein [Tepidibacter aestuarii]CAH2213805.1 Oxidoreductase [Tepidibacter aestuarii]